MAIKKYTLTMVDKNGKTGKATFKADDDGSHTSAIAIANAIDAHSWSGIVSLSASESVVIATTNFDPLSESALAKCKVQYVLVVGTQRSFLMVNIPDPMSTLVSAESPLLGKIDDPIGIYTDLRSEEGNTPQQKINWAKYVCKAPKIV